MKRFNICIVRPEGLVHASAFCELAEAIHYTLINLGYQSQINENLIADKNNIILGCHLLAYESHLPDDTIIINTEQMASVHNMVIDWADRITHFIKKYKSWDYSVDNIKYFHNLGLNVEYLPIGYVEQLNRIEHVEKDIDVLFYGRTTPERIEILTQCEALRLKVEYLFGVYQQERDQYIARSKIVLNLHSLECKIFELVRVHYLLNNSVLVVSQFDQDTKVESPCINGLVLASHENIAQKCYELVHNQKLREKYERKGRESLKMVNMKQALRVLLED